MSTELDNRLVISKERPKASTYLALISPILGYFYSKLLVTLFVTFRLELIEGLVGGREEGQGSTLVGQQVGQVRLGEVVGEDGCASVVQFVQQGSR